jgi:hypothetical protein
MDVVHSHSKGATDPSNVKLEDTERNRKVVNRFVEIKVKRQIYNEKPALTIFVSDATKKKFWAKLKR